MPGLDIVPGVTLLLVVVWALACSVDGADMDDGEPAELAGITQLHNDVRAMVGVAALTWDPELAKVAQSWAEACQDIRRQPGSSITTTAAAIPIPAMWARISTARPGLLPPRER